MTPTPEQSPTILGLPIAVFVALVADGFGLVGVFLGQLMQNRKALRRERMAELRRVLAEFAAAGFTTIAEKERHFVAVRSGPDYAAKVEAGQLKPLALERWDKMLERADSDLYRAVDRMGEARCRIMLLDPAPANRKEVEALYYRTLDECAAVDAADKQITDEAFGEGMMSLRDDLTQWMLGQSNRTDI
jgi:hypothetical protein